MTDEKNILYKKDYVTAAKTDIRKTFAKFRKEQKQTEKISTIEKTQSTNVFPTIKIILDKINKTKKILYII